MPSNIHLRGLNDQLLDRLKQTALAQKVSMNKLVLNMLQQSVGLECSHKPQIFHDLDKLAGTWSTQEAKEFLGTIADFEQIDEELWK